MTDDVGLHELRIAAKYAGTGYTKTPELLFTVDVKDPCAEAELTI